MSHCYYQPFTVSTLKGRLHRLIAFAFDCIVCEFGRLFDRSELFETVFRNLPFFFAFSKLFIPVYYLLETFLYHLEMFITTWKRFLPIWKCCGYINYQVNLNFPTYQNW